MSRIPPALARRIDGAARRAHAFHRWAHHPLCQPYASELLRVKRTRICKGCAFAGAGGLAGAALALAMPPPPAALALVGALACAAATALALLPRPEAVHPRPPKVVTRSLPMLLGLWSAIAGLRTGGAGIVAALLSGAALAAGVGAYRRRGPARAPCETCPERTRSTVCAGFRPIARREAALGRLADRWLREAGVVPSPQRHPAPRRASV